MISFEYLFVLLLLPAPLLIRRFMPRYQYQDKALYFSNISALESANTPSSEIAMSNERPFFLVGMWLVYSALLIALAKPIFIKAPIIKEVSQRDILIAIDLSASMQEKDFSLPDGKVLDRLEAQKVLLRDFIRKREERFALLFYGSGAYVQTPFTNDTKALIRLLDEAQIGMAGPKTVIGDAIALAIKLYDELDERDSKDRLMILLSDGSDAGSRVPPQEAAKLAQKAGIKIETVAIGDTMAIERLKG